jgi:uncharacterized SAM-binding protein YcdF (DUF218 family)
MIVPETNLRSARRVGPLSGKKLGRIIAAIVVLGAIAVFGAAEYDGRPSPVLRARLDHGLALYRQNIAPLVITLGGGAPADRHSEGGVGRAYLMAHGVPGSAIIAETKSDNTEQSARRLARIARANHLGLIIVVSDGTHLFRVHALCSSMGLNVLTSPRPERGLPFSLEWKRTIHEILSYTFWRLKWLVGIRN